jgi:hypothetical protein
MITTTDMLQAFTHLNGMVVYDGDDWSIVLLAADDERHWVDNVYLTEQEKDRIYDVLRTPNLPTPVNEFIRALQ